MNKIATLMFAAVVITGTSLAQTSAGMQNGRSASQSTSVSADKSGARANSSTSASTSHQANASSKNAQLQSAGQLQSGTVVQAELTKPVDVRKNKPGDDVVAKTTQDVKSDGRVVLPKGSKVVGRVTQAQARAKGQAASELGIVFDHAVMKDGTQVLVSFAIQAIGSSQAQAASNMADDSLMTSGSASGMATASGSAASRGLAGGLTSTTGSVLNTAGGATGSLSNVGGAGAGLSGALSSNSRGVVGLPGLSLVSAASSTTTTGSVISSNRSNVHLDSGTQMVLRAVSH